MGEATIYIVIGVPDMRVNGRTIFRMERVLKLGQVILLYKYKDGTRYEGTYLNGKKNGKGQLNFIDESKYRGEFLNNEITGIGEYYWNDGKIYKGEWKNNKMYGKGEIT